jgi:hypothetical protein
LQAAATGVSPRHKSEQCWGHFGVQKSKRPWRHAQPQRLLNRKIPKRPLPSLACDTLFPPTTANLPANANPLASDTFAILRILHVGKQAVLDKTVNYSKNICKQ